MPWLRTYYPAYMPLVGELFFCIYFILYYQLRIYPFFSLLLEYDDATYSSKLLHCSFEIFFLFSKVNTAVCYKRQNIVIFVKKINLLQRLCHYSDQ